jgi:hypothetical protein
MSKKKFTVGTDPEFFLRREGRLVSAIGVINGTKMNPMNLGDNVGLSYDNVALEFSTQVCKSGHQFVHAIKNAFRLVSRAIPEMFRIDTNTPAAYFPEEELANVEANQFGCDPDFNAWTLKMNRPPDRTNYEALRSCGGHVHVGQHKGYEFLLDPHGKIMTVMAMDIVLGISSIILDTSPMASERRKLYGKAGAHRPTDYGVEYRTISNFWLKHPCLVRLIHSFTKDALDLVDSGALTQMLEKIPESVVQRTINNSDLTHARFLFNKHVLPLLSEGSKRLWEEALNFIDDNKGRISLQAAWQVV